MFRLNTPEFFAAAEESDYVEYLNLHANNYFVAEESNKIIGAGGVNFGFDNGTTAKITWDMVHPEKHGKGIGFKLTRFRIDEIKKNPDVKRIVVRTSQLVHKFYEKIGFKLENIKKTTGLKVLTFTK